MPLIVLILMPVHLICSQNLFDWEISVFANLRFEKDWLVLLSCSQTPDCRVSMVGGEGNELHFCGLLGPSVLEERNSAVLLSDTDSKLVVIIFSSYPKLFVNVWIQDIRMLKL